MVKTEYQTGVYQIRNVVNGKVYVGSSSQSLKYRWEIHRAKLRAGRHGNRYLQNAWNKHGETAFRFEIIERCSPRCCVKREQHWIDCRQSVNPRLGYNRNPTAGSMLGFRHSEETKAKMGAAGRGRRHREDVKACISRKMSVVMLGNKHFEGCKHTEEAKTKIAAAARSQWKDKEHRAKVAAKNRATAQAQWKDPEYRAKHRAAMIAWAVKRRESSHEVVEVS